MTTQLYYNNNTGTLDELDNAYGHLVCTIDVTSYPYFCSEHDVYLYDPLRDGTDNE